MTATETDFIGQSLRYFHKITEIAKESLSDSDIGQPSAACALRPRQGQQRATGERLSEETPHPKDEMPPMRPFVFPNPRTFAICLLCDLFGV